MSCSITSHECSRSARVLAVYRMVLNKVKSMLVWSLRPSSILGCLVAGTVMNERKQSKNQKKKYKIFNDNQAYNQPERYGRYLQYGHQNKCRGKDMNYLTQAFLNLS
jgi:hypothetical protein